MDLRKIYEKYCLTICPERKIYGPRYSGYIGICPHCKIDNFISYALLEVDKYTFTLPYREKTNCNP